MKKSASSKKQVPVRQNKKPAKPASNGKLSEEEFTLRAIDRLHKPKYAGIHTVYSGFNAAFRDYFGSGADPVATTQQLATAGKLVIMPSRHGVIIYKKGEEPKLVPSKQDEVLAKILK